MRTKAQRLNVRNLEKIQETGEGQDMVWNSFASLNFKATNFRPTGSKKSSKRKTLMYCNEKKNLIGTLLSYMHCTVQTQTLLLSR